MFTNKLYLTNGKIIADGEDTSNPTSGGGAGGTLYIAFNKLLGTGTLSANGGSGQTSGGAGSGGRIKLFFFSWYDVDSYPFYNQESKIQISVAGGDS